MRFVARGSETRWCFGVGNPKLVLLGGFLASSHQFRNLIPALADRFHVLSPDYSGFGNSDIPDPTRFAHTFDHVSLSPCFPTYIRSLT